MLNELSPRGDRDLSELRLEWRDVQGVDAEDSGMPAPETTESGPLRDGEAHPGPISDGFGNRVVIAPNIPGRKLETWKSGILTSVGTLDKQTIKVWSRAYSRHSPAHLACRECTALGHLAVSPDVKNPRFCRDVLRFSAGISTRVILYPAVLIGDSISRRETCNWIYRPSRASTLEITSGK